MVISDIEETVDDKWSATVKPVHNSSDTYYTPLFAMCLFPH